MDLANTFLDIAETFRLGEIRIRNIDNAWKAHDSAADLAPRVGLTDSELFTIGKRLRGPQNALVKIEDQDLK